MNDDELKINNETNEVEINEKDFSPETVPKEQYLRLMADVQNIKRNAQEDLIKRGKLSQAELLRKLLPLIDMWDKALEHIPDKESSSYQGLEAIRKQMKTVFQGMDLVALARVGDKFDPEKHEALAQIPSTEEMETDHIISVEQQGYSLGDYVIYPAKVIVSS